MASIGTLTAEIGMNTSPLARGVRTTERLMGGLRKTVGKLTSGMGLLTGAVAAAGGALSVGFVKSTIAATDAIGKTADKIGVTVEALQELRFAASQSGISQQLLESSLARLGKRLGEAEAGSKTLDKGLTILGLTTKDLVGIPLDESLRRIADRLPNVTKQTDRLAAATAFFGREGLDFVNILRLGSQGIEELQQKARDLGLVLSDDMVRGAEAANDQIDIMQRVLKVQLTSVVVSLAPKITAMGESFAKIVKSLRGVEGVNLSDTEQAIKDLALAIKGAADNAGTLVSRLQSLPQNVGFTIFRVTEAFKEANARRRVQLLAKAGDITAEERDRRLAEIREDFKNRRLSALGVVPESVRQAQGILRPRPGPRESLAETTRRLIETTTPAPKALPQLPAGRGAPVGGRGGILETTAAEGARSLFSMALGQQQEDLRLFREGLGKSRQFTLETLAEERTVLEQLRDANIGKEREAQTRINEITRRMARIREEIQRDSASKIIDAQSKIGEAFKKTAEEVTLSWREIVSSILSSSRSIEGVLTSLASVVSKVLAARKTGKQPGVGEPGGPQGPPLPPSLLDKFGGISGILTAGAQGAGVGSLASRITGGQGGLGSTIGGAAGGIAGSFFGPAGQIAGSAIGGILGGLFDKNKTKDPVRKAIKVWVSETLFPELDRLGRIGFGPGVFGKGAGTNFFKLLGFEAGVPQAILARMQRLAKDMQGIIGSALGKAFEAFNLDSGFMRFQETLRDGIAKFVQQGMIKGLLKGSQITRTLAPFFEDIERATRRFSRGKIGADEFEQQTGRALTGIDMALGGFEPTLNMLGGVLNRLDDIIQGNEGRDLFQAIPPNILATINVTTGDINNGMDARKVGTEAAFGLEQELSRVTI